MLKALSEQLKWLPAAYFCFFSLSGILLPDKEEMDNFVTKQKGIFSSCLKLFSLEDCNLPAYSSSSK